MKKTIFETNYDRLVKLNIVQNDVLRASGRSRPGGFMDLVVEPVPMLDNVNGRPCEAVSLAHYFKQNGDLCQDPEMVVLVYPELRMAEAFSFQQAIPPIYQEVYPAPGKVFPRLKKDLNTFLRQWLINLIQQGHGRAWV